MIKPRSTPVRPPPAPSKLQSARRGRGYFKRIVVGVLVAFVSINLGLLLLADVDIEDIERAQGAVDQWALVLFLFRFILYTAIWRHWTAVTVWFARRRLWEMRRVLKKRAEILGYFVLLELIISGSFLIRVLS